MGQQRPGHISSSGRCPCGRMASYAERRRFQRHEGERYCARGGKQSDARAEDWGGCASWAMGCEWGRSARTEDFEGRATAEVEGGGRGPSPVKMAGRLHLREFLLLALALLAPLLLVVRLAARRLVVESGESSSWNGLRRAAEATASL